MGAASRRNPPSPAPHRTAPHRTARHILTSTDRCCMYELFKVTDSQPAPARQRYEHVAHHPLAESRVAMAPRRVAQPTALIDPARTARILPSSPLLFTINPTAQRSIDSYPDRQRQTSPRTASDHPHSTPHFLPSLSLPARTKRNETGWPVPAQPTQNPRVN